MVEIIPKPTAKFPPWQNILYYLSVVLLIAGILTFFTLNHFIKKTETELKALEETLTKEKTAEEIALEKTVFDYQKKIQDFFVLINQHRYSWKFFDFFQGVCHPQVWFPKFTLNLKEYRVLVSGQTDSFSILAQQLLILQEEEKILGVELPQVSIGKEGKIDFLLNLSFDPKIVK